LKKIEIILNENSKGYLKEVRNEFSEIVEFKEKNGKVVLFMKWNAKKFKRLIEMIEFEDITIEDISLEDVFEELYKPDNVSATEANEVM